ncbi:head-tail connector protein [Novosphingobium kaempferiae]|uniref:head-tail connector protein n=1 Tax=Novosphingobium kaempferiae TaxID=2896849 RepID=UPI001E2FF786|nr:head-tail connector protein [Novosphingobium kaempferiae]
MIFELLHAPFPDGYGEAILSLDDCKLHLRVDLDEDDDLIAALRDASIDFVERYCAVKLMATQGNIWTASRFPGHITRALKLGISPVREIASVSWRSLTGDVVSGTPNRFSFTSRGDVLPAIGADWPNMVAGGIEIEFSAGYDAGKAPPALLSAVRMFLGHLYKNREAVTDRGIEAEVPFGVRQLCSTFRRAVI